MIVFIDTNIPMYAAGKEHPLKDSCLDIMRSVASGDLKAYTDTEVFQEILYRYFSINKREFGLQLFDTYSLIMHGSVLSVHHEDMILARKLSDEISNAILSPRDLIHLAVMLNHGIGHIITTDRAFEKIGSIQVIYPF
ncbi:MAG: type II toxin-antitoxin system VapC family toxin [Bacillota bacterium]|nr:type II toxin-antitoxin system VapC family toxin [Bacillota bacterium]